VVLLCIRAGKTLRDLGSGGGKLADIAAGGREHAVRLQQEINVLLALGQAEKLFTYSLSHITLHQE
jgi:hypothetical protein